ncbi:hypothetical protein RB619_02150 [Flavobacterium sp. LHD-80]|uniref:hypothetical protein n=1 Tax=Flavobacterium sp. LHD-80 TaxID=3071411 RepID=UPI0027DF3AFB|nr:hypothetical protein [Flavobacterium sp. LHD-80]MDQ6469428.1 hypothetical protein [Flavobacterium sp. LHD-80]
MKKYASLLLFALLLNGCDDGDLTVETLDFKDVAATTCDPTTNTLIYKLKPQETLLLQMPEGKLINDATVDGKPLVYDIDDKTFRFFYRAYDGAVSVSNVCDAIPPATPNVNQEWRALSGKLQIVTEQINKTPAPADGHTEIVGYNHNITLVNATFSKPGPVLVNDEYVFGDFKTTAEPVVVAFTDEVAKYCNVQFKVYNNNLSNALVIENLDKSLIVDEDTPTGQPRKSLISLPTKDPAVTSNNLYYRIYSGNLPELPKEKYFCVDATPTTPAVKDTWVGVAGVANVSGIIEITTTHTLKVYKHKVYIKNATMKKGNSTFKLATDFYLGEVTTIAP